jgi:septum formation protein
MSIALYKMNHVVLPGGKIEGDICFVLTADTMSYDVHGNISAKPKDRADAINKIKTARQGSSLCTGFCVDRKIWLKGAWRTQERVTNVVSAELVFSIPDEMIDEYLENVPFLDVSGAIAVEHYGNQFLKTVVGSYSTIIGLPMFEVRQALAQLEFFAAKYAYGANIW